MLVRERTKQRFTGIIKMVSLFTFDANGEYQTDDIRLITKLKRKFRYEELHKCKKCDYTCDNKGLLKAHYREKHPKE